MLVEVVVRRALSAVAGLCFAPTGPAPGGGAVLVVAADVAVAESWVMAPINSRLRATVFLGGGAFGVRTAVHSQFLRPWRIEVSGHQERCALCAVGCAASLGMCEAHLSCRRRPRAQTVERLPLCTLAHRLGPPWDLTACNEHVLAGFALKNAESLGQDVCSGRCRPRAGQRGLVRELQRICG